MRRDMIIFLLTVSGYSASISNRRVASVAGAVSSQITSSRPLTALPSVFKWTATAYNTNKTTWHRNTSKNKKTFPFSRQANRDKNQSIATSFIEYVYLCFIILFLSLWGQKVSLKYLWENLNKDFQMKWLYGYLAEMISIVVDFSALFKELANQTVQRLGGSEIIQQLESSFTYQLLRRCQQGNHTSNNCNQIRGLNKGNYHDSVSVI